MSKNFISLDGEKKELITENDRVDKALSELEEAAKNGNLLTGDLVSVDVINEKNYAIAVVFYKGVQVLIPFKMFIPDYMIKNTDVKGSEIILRRRLMSETVFKVIKVDRERQVAVGDRVQALNTIKNDVLFRKDSDNNWLIRNGTIAEARVVTSTNSWIIVEVFGVEKRIFSPDISYRRLLGLKEYYSPGDVVKVYIKNINRDVEGKKVKLDINIKDVYGDPTAKLIDKYKEGEIHVGQVTYIDNNGFYVSLKSGAEALCRVSSVSNKPIIGSNVSVYITNIDKDTKRLFGTIFDISGI